MSYLARLKKNSEKHHATNQQNQQNLAEGGFAGFAGSLTGDFQKSANDPTAAPASHWLIHFADRDPMEVWTAPPATHDEILALYPDAVAAVPITDHTSTRSASTSERNELLALLEVIYADDTEAGRQEAIGLALADPEGALPCYRAIATERGLSVSKPVSKPVSTETAPEILCRTCRHRTTPGRADPGYCAERTDQSKAYGEGHPLHQLPADGGTDCPKWAPHE